MPGTGNTTVPSPEDPPSSSSLAFHGARVVPALFLMWSHDQPDRIGQVALFDPHLAAFFILGREVVGGPLRVHFHQLRPGASFDGGPLTGINISHDQLHITVMDGALWVRNIGTPRVLADGTEVPRDSDVLLRPGTVLEVPGNCVLLVGQSPLSFPPPPAQLLPLHAIGEADRIGIVGESWRAQQLRQDTCYAASTGKHVFVHGPSGTGKEDIARAIHKMSSRSAGPYITANSASFTAELAALELFGSPRNYPNPGTPERVGYFAEAKGGTLLLDEIGEVLTTVQAPLLRALDGAYNRIGDPVSRPTGCVVILATNRGPQSIKHDVLHRLGVTVETPALAERREDIPLIVRALLRRRGHRIEVHTSLIVGLLRSPLAGNVREVDNILTLAIGTSGAQRPLRWPSRLSMPPPAPLAAPQEPERQAEPAPPAEVPVPEASDLGKEHLLRVLMENKYDLKKTAAALGLSIGQLYRLRQKHGLVWRD